MADTLLAIDGNSLVFRAYWALPTTMHDKEGRAVNAVYGFFTMLFHVVEEYHPTYIAVAFDRREKTFRHKKYAEYKAGRKKTPDELLEQIPMLQEALGLVGITCVDQAGYEADDIIGALSMQAERENIPTFIFTADKDQLQLIDRHINVVLTKKGVTETKLMTQETLMEELGIAPRQIPDLKALMGDASDNIPGVAGIGEKTALKLLHEYSTIEELYEHLESLPKNKLYEKLTLGKESAYMSKDLAIIEKNMPLKKEISEFKFKEFNLEGMRELCERYGFTSFQKRFGLTNKEEKKETKATIISPNELEILDDAYEFSFFVRDGVHIAIDSETEYVIPIRQNLLGDGYDMQEIMQALRPFFERKKVIAHDVKALMHEWGEEIFRDFYDTMLAAWVLNPSYSKYDFSSVMKRASLAENAAALFELSEIQRDEIEREGLDAIFYDVEQPLLKVLFEMETEGFRVSSEALTALGKKYDMQIEKLTQEIYEFAGEPFNISSTKQLSEILFEKLELPVIKKTKTGYSTDIEVLEKLEGKHPIISRVIEYRSLTKLKGTYIDGLLNMVREGMIHTTFLQTATATGRLSSAEPNLQNIPIKSPMASDIRNAFPAPDGFQIVSADYSQIELRILAAIADDKHLKDAFSKEQDIHARTAAEILGKPIEEITPTERASAKAVNFGIVYGISDFGLARNLGISRKQAADYIARYFEEFSGVRKYMDEIIAQAHQDGFVRTLWGRIRYIPELSSGNYNIRSFGERAALNTPIQGSAADIIKIAMNKVQSALKEEKFRSKLVLQVHDELILYVKEEEYGEVTELLRSCMENTVDLDVPLRVNIASGKTWAEAK